MNPILIAVIIVAVLAVLGLWRILADGRKLRARQEQEQRQRVAEKEREMFSPKVLAARAAEYRRTQGDLAAAATAAAKSYDGLGAALARLGPDDLEDDETKTWPGPPAEV